MPYRDEGFTAISGDTPDVAAGSSPIGIFTNTADSRQQGKTPLEGAVR